MKFVLLEPGNPTVWGKLDRDLLPSDCLAWLRNDLPDAVGCVELLSVTQTLKPGAASMTVTKRFGPESPLLYSLCLGGTPLGKGEKQITKLHLVEFAQNRAVTVTDFLLRDAVIQDIQFQRTPDGQCIETLQLGFSEIVWNFNPLNPLFPDPGSRASGWSFTTNAAIASISS